ncbi:hypothetical protein [Pleionea sp. CnH1-48]|uniref:hypothetical protein n=1 Tax=Pleionea sp. CnH1-48 TaxID=2954494 RepID=UPI002096C5AD|nr:hypothetical protein [Pleionea sp. CnH1-48]MCO7222966.1 hypothetical protein [Pleionea sp. CnH1-48]
MAFFLQLLGGIVLSLLILAALAYFYFKRKFGKYLDLDGNVASGEPLHIHLNEEIEPDWLDEKSVKAAITELEGLGFQKGKSYNIHEMEGVALLVFFKAPLALVLYKHNIVGHWVDIVVDEKEGKEYTFSNAAMGSQMENRPESIKHYYPEASISDVCAEAEKLLSTIGNDFIDINEDNFREYFETAYKKDISFKVRKGGVSFKEFVATSNEAPFNSSDETVKEAFLEYKEQELDQWHEAALEEYRELENIEEEKFYDLEHSFLIVPFKTHSPAFIQYLLGRGFVTEQQEKQLMKAAEKVSDVNKLFERMNEMLSPELRATFVKDIDYPLPIKLFKMSTKMLDRY